MFSKLKSKLSTKGFVVHGIINFCLMAVILVTIVACGLFANAEAVSAFKSYRGVIYAGNEKTNKVALMINVYWGTEYLEDILKILDQYDVKCTFFLGKTWVDEHKELTLKLYESGHELANHGSYHKEHAKLGYDANAKEIKGLEDSVFAVTGVKTNLFAPPGGSYNNDTVKAATDLGYKTILWTKDTIDWKDKDANLIYQRATNGVSSGDLILMHPTGATRDALKNIIETIKSKKLTLDTVSNTIKE